MVNEEGRCWGAWDGGGEGGMVAIALEVFHGFHPYVTTERPQNVVTDVSGGGVSLVLTADRVDACSVTLDGLSVTGNTADEGEWSSQRAVVQGGIVGVLFSDEIYLLQGPCKAGTNKVFCSAFTVSPYLPPPIHLAIAPQNTAKLQRLSLCRESKYGSWHYHAQMIARTLDELVD